MLIDHRWRSLIFISTILYNINLISSLGDFSWGYQSPISCSNANEICDVTSKIGLDQIAGSLQAFGDFNSDKYVDIFSVNTIRDTLYVSIWSIEGAKFQISTSLKPTGVGYITNVAASDFNYDGKMDVAVSGHPKTNWDGKSVLTEIYLGNNQVLAADPVASLESSCEMLLLDWNGDLQTDFLACNKSNSNPIFYTNSYATFTSSPFPTGGASLPLSVGAANGFSDFDGDCLSDIFIVKEGPCQGNNCNKTFEIWINKRQGNFEMARSFTRGPSNFTGQPTFADFNGDGTIDIAIGFCGGVNCSISTVELIFNTQIELCGLLETTNCRSAQDLCVSDSNFDLSYSSITTLSSPLRKDSHHSYFLRAGDFDLDGYVDLIIGVSNSGEARTEVWRNVMCSTGQGDQCGPTDSISNPGTLIPAYRTFRKIETGMDSLEQMFTESHCSPRDATFFDLDEDGVTDILVNCKSATGESVKAFYNNFFNDAFFLKTTGLNGVCSGWCDTDPKFPDPKPYGVNYGGGAWKFTVSDLSGKQRIAEGIQLSQTSYGALQTPYILFGLGRTSNYIEQVFYGSTFSTAAVRMWICIIPNAQLVAIPYPMQTTDSWTLELFIKTSSLTAWVVVAFLTCLIINGIVIGVFVWQERRMDKKMLAETSSMFSYRAL